ncbi:MAG: hypothetical protein KF791_16810 [Verrucomicrobiae bacterium]|nr:hypothetical protein [Verrucomicrobiae bacterium]
MGDAAGDPRDDPSIAPEIEDLAAALKAMGCPPDRSIAMACQLERRARQLASQTSRTRDEALLHLLKLMAGGWANRPPEAPTHAVVPSSHAS